MPELPEVENFRQLLLPLVGNELSMELFGDHPRVKIDELLGANSTKKKRSVVCTDILRRGKQISLVLSLSGTIRYLFLHMGMTGKIRVYGKLENWGDKKDTDNTGHSKVPLEDETSPPKYTCMIFSSSSSNYTAYFCDPRKFGSAYVANDLTDLESLAPDALSCTNQETVDNHIIPALTNQRLGIKAILLDQKRAVSGVGNWVADEVLYQCKIHPDQTKLDVDESKVIYKKLHDIVSIAVQSLENDDSYPSDWLFHYRWTGKKAGKDAEGRSISFITSGGRTSAVINTLQKLYKRSTQSPTREIKSVKVESSSDVAPTGVDMKHSNASRPTPTTGNRATETAKNEVKRVTPVKETGVGMKDSNASRPATGKRANGSVKNDAKRVTPIKEDSSPTSNISGRKRTDETTDSKNNSRRRLTKLSEIGETLRRSSRRSTTSK